jgi:aryl-alcohol dehydrogenase-like predicted oxidoreductase
LARSRGYCVLIPTDAHLLSALLQPLWRFGGSLHQRAALFSLCRRFDTHRVTAERADLRKAPTVERPLAKPPPFQPFRNGSRARIFKEIDDSLRRLRTDTIDLYQVHWPDPNTPMEETAGAMSELHKAGKIRAIGVSNFSPAQMDAFAAVAPLHVVQPPYNLFERAIEADVFPYARSQRLAMLAYGALCRGLLSGRMRPDTQFPASDLRSKDPKFQQPHYGEYLAAVSALDRLAQERFGKRVIHLALRWVLDRAPNTIALWGARHPGQLDPVSDVLGWIIAADSMREIDRTVAQHARTPLGPESLRPVS